jgi:hypothetical protein
LDRIGHAALLAGVVLVYLILFAAPWSDRARAQVALLILTLVACVVAMARKTPDQD